MSFDRQDRDAIRAEINRLRRSNSPWDHKRADELALGPLLAVTTNNPQEADETNPNGVNETAGRGTVREGDQRG